LNNTYIVSTDKQLLDIDLIHAFLSKEAYWSRGIPKATLFKSIENSLCFGVYSDTDQVGFARVITDYATIAYLGDLFILESHRGKGLSKQLINAIMSHDELQGLRRWILLTGDAHELYRKYGWTNLADPSVWKELHNKSVYRSK